MAIQSQDIIRRSATHSLFAVNIFHYVGIGPNRTSEQDEEHARQNDEMADEYFRHTTVSTEFGEETSSSLV
ncbi:formate dehydrogenase N subunit beta transmembrane domain-containing protein [Photorhabdus sp. P32]|uniref:formate dehydrogenase N subunit beta transmembrane domain-containing protein n=1 Tax=Photorhabdus sp. P32 TaxID=3117549 RepID=UPI00311AD376